MFSKILVGIATVACVGTLAIPAGAATDVRHASFGVNGQARLGYMHGRWIGAANIKGLPPGHYVVYGYMFEDTNHDGVPEGGATADLCNIVLRAKRHAGHCKGSATNPFLDFVRGPGSWGEINGIGVIRLEDQQVVLDQPLS